MKKIVLLITMLFALLIKANAQSGTVEVFSEDGDRFWVIINGQKQNPQPLANVKVPSVKEKWFKMRLIFEDETIPNLDQQVQLVGVEEKWMDVVYSVKKKAKGKYVVRISSWKESTDQGNSSSNTVITNNATTQTETVPTQTNTTVITTSSPNNNTTSTTTTTETTNINTNTMGVGTNVNVKDDGQNVNMNINLDLSGVNAIMSGGTNNTSAKTTTTTKSTTTTSTTNGYNEGPNTNTQTRTTTTQNTTAPVKKTCTTAMSSTDFNSAKESIASKGFDDTRLQVANQILKSNCVSVAQVIGIMSVFGFEETKLKFAKSAYDKTVDKNNYYKVNDAFSYSSSIDELNSYIESK